MKSPTLGLTHHTPKAMLAHLHRKGAALNDIDVTELIEKMHSTRDVTESPAMKFACDKVEKKLNLAGITVQPKVCWDLAKAAFIAMGNFESALYEFKAKSTRDQTFNNFHAFIINKYAHQVHGFWYHK